MVHHLTATGRHLPYGITQRYLPPNANERPPPNPSRAGWYLIYLPQRDGRLSWPRWFDSAESNQRPFNHESDAEPLHMSAYWGWGLAERNLFAIMK